MIALPGIVPYIGSTEREAADLAREPDELRVPAYGPRQLAAVFETEPSAFELDEPLPASILSRPKLEGSHSRSDLIRTRGARAVGGRHAVLHLENVMTELHAVTIRNGLGFPNYYSNWQDAEPLDPAVAGHAKLMPDQLAWWAGALRTARAASPYPA